jgi:signal transduction histidine kinase
MKPGRLLRSFKSKIVLSILVVGIMAVFIGLIINYWVGRKQIQKEIGAQFSELAYETSQKLRFLMEHNIEEAKLLARASELRSVANQAVTNQPDTPPTDEEIRERNQRFDEDWTAVLNNSGSAFLQDFLRDPEKRAHHISIIATDKRGFVIAADTKPAKAYYGNEQWWRAGFNRGIGGIYVSDVELVQPATSEFEPVYGLALVVPIMDQSRMHAIGVFRTVVQIKAFFEAVIKVKIGKTDHTMLASSDGTLIFCPIFLIRNHTLEPEFTQAIFQDQPGWTLTNNDVHYRGRQSINGFSPLQLSPDISPASLGGKRWYVFTSQNPDETYLPITALQKWMALSGIMGAVVLSFFGIYVAGFIVKPLQNLRKGARLIGYGNLDHRLRLDTGDELQDLADEFNEMAIKLKASYAGLEQKVAERTNELAVANKITKIISSSLNLHVIFELLAEEVGKLVDFDLISLSLLDPTHENIETRLVKVKKGPFTSRNFPARPKAGTAVGFAVDSGQPLIWNLSPDQPKYVEDRLARRDGYQSFITVPIISKQMAVGTLNLVSRKPAAYSKRSLDILVPIAEQLAIAIETIRFFEETKLLDQLKSDFVSKVSHELRTPLTSIKGFTEILLTYGDVDSKTKKEFLTIINEESERLTRLINDILDLSKIEAGKLEWQIQPVSLTELVDYVVKLFQPIAQEKNLMIRTQVSENLPKVHGDWDQLLQVMDNLLSNAIKFTASGSISILVSREDHNVRLSVRDTGIGISKEDLKKVFNKFHQLGDARSGRPRGTGLGLAICKEIIEHLGGRTWCESEPGRGSTFIFVLPEWNKDHPTESQAGETPLKKAADPAKSKI